MKIGITADCSSGLEYFPHKHGVQITRTTINFNEEILLDGVDITADGFYEKLSTSNIVPTTSAPTMGEILKTINYYKDKGYTDVIHFPISFNLSTYGRNLVNIVEELDPEINYHVFNTRSATIVQGYLAYYAEKLAANGYTVEEIFTECNNLRNNMKAYFVVDDLKYLVKNGRLSSAAGLIGNLARVKPILELNADGKIETFEKVRTHRRALNRILDLVKTQSDGYEKVVYIVLHTARLKDAEELVKSIAQTQKNAVRVEIATVTPTVGAHIGCGVLGVGRIVLDDLKEEL